MHVVTSREADGEGDALLVHRGVNAPAGPAEKTLARWRRCYPAQGKQAAEDCSSELA